MTRGPADLRTNSGYRRLLAASAVSNLGDGIGVIAYPWLASALTRSPFLIALIAMARGVPWLLFSLPAGVMTDRLDRRRLIVSMDISRFVITIVVALAVMARQNALPDPSELTDAKFTSTSLYLLLLTATLLVGCAEVLRDNSAQTMMPSIVDADGLEVSNGRLQSTELVANSFVGPPLGSFLVLIAFSVPIFVDAITFAVAAALVAAIPGSFTPEAVSSERRHWTRELSEGVRWLWSHRLLKTLAITLGLLNLLGTMTIATFVLFAQELLNTSPREFALLNTGMAVGGVAGGMITAPLTRRLGPGPCLWLLFIFAGGSALVIGMASHWIIVWFMLALSTMFGVVWNVITVSLRQTVIPDRLLGRVNSVYRFFGWGMMPVGALLGGVVVAATDAFSSRELSLRMPWLVAGVAYFVLFAAVARKVTTTNIETARHATEDPAGC